MAQPVHVIRDRYELYRKLARGGMAEVFLARDRTLDRPVAVKVMFPEFATDPTFVERFRREAKSAARLNHQNIVGVYDWGEERGTYFLVMEYIDGPSVAEVLKRDGPFKPERAAEIAADVASALGAANAVGVIHRDIKPGNIMLTREGRAKVTDFGIARLAHDPENELTKVGSVMGTATYFSPEQAQGHALDGRSDLYSLGAVLYEMLTGRPPFQAESPVAIAYKHVQERPPRPAQLNPSVPLGIEAITLRLLTKNPDSRYATAQELWNDLRRFRMGQTTAAEMAALGTVGGQDPATQPVSTVDGATQVVGAVPVESYRAGAPGQPGVVGGGGQPHDSGDIDPSDEDLDDPADRKRAKVLAVVLIVLLALLGGVVYGLTRVVKKDDSAVVATVPVPNVENKTQSEAEAALKEVGLKPAVKAVKDDAVQVGLVARTDPPAGTRLEKGDTVTLYVSTGSEQIAIPEVVGIQREAAELQLKNAGLINVVANPEETSDSEPGTVLSVLPTQGTKVAPTDLVTIRYAAAPSEVAIPDVTGSTVETAIEKLQAAGFQIGEKQFETSETVADGRVIGTRPSSSALKGAVLALRISSGSANVRVPAVKGLAEATARAAIEAVGLKVDASTADVSATPEQDGLVISAVPGAGEPVQKGSSVQIVIGAVRETTTTPTTATSTSTTASTTTTTSTTAPTTTSTATSTSTTTSAP